MAQYGCDGYEKVRPIVYRVKGKDSLRQHRAGNVAFIVRGDEEDSVCLFIGSRLQKIGRINRDEDEAAWDFNSVEVTLKGTQDITLVNHDKKQYARFRTTDRFRIVDIYVSKRTWWVKKTNLNIILE